MPRNEAMTDIWINKLLNDANINATYQGTNIKSIDDALKTGSKKLNGNKGAPDFIGVVKDFLIIVEDKQDIGDHIYENNDVIVTNDSNIVPYYAVNGALFYAQHILKRTDYTKAFVFGSSGDEKHHKITPVFVDDRSNYQILKNVDSFISFNENNIYYYYKINVLHEDTDEQKDSNELLKTAAKLNEDLRNYSTLSNHEKPIVVSGILLALSEIKHNEFSLNGLNGDTQVENDGAKIMTAIRKHLKRSNVSPDIKKDKLLGQFNIIETSTKLNTVNNTLNKTPLKYYSEFLYNTIYRNIKYTQSSEDYLGRFYSEFMSYGGGDGQSLGIILTPKHITKLCCDLLNLKQDDTVLDPTCGTGGFLVAAMRKMLKETNSRDFQRQNSIRKHQLIGIEQNEYMYTIATTNMILRGDGKSNLLNKDFLAYSSDKIQLQQPNVGLMNPPYSQGSKDRKELYEISFIEHLLDSLTQDGRAAVIVPQSTMIGHTKVEKTFKGSILSHHTLECVITCNENTFYGVGTNPVIAIFTTHNPHPIDKQVKFIDFRDDGYIVKKHVGLVDDGTVTDKRKHMLDVWNGKVGASSKFFVKSKITPNDEWLHSFFHFNDEIPNEKDFDNSVSDYLSFDFNNSVHK